MQKDLAVVGVHLESKEILKYEDIIKYYKSHSAQFVGGNCLSIENKPDREIFDIFLLQEDLFWLNEPGIFTKTYLFSCMREDLQPLFENISELEVDDFKYYLKYQKDKKFKKTVIKPQKEKTVLVL